jgi:ATP-binding cassette, subfamily C, bacteriocin exporter
MMIDLYKRIYVRQSTQSDCGMACLSMIFKYTGIAINDEVMGIPADPTGMSLSELKQIAAKHGLVARPVEMEVDHLAELQHPIILHVQTEHQEWHYIVLLRTERSKGARRYLIADPATQINYISENELHERWTTRTALYFNYVRQAELKTLSSPFFLVWKLKGFPNGLLAIVPMLTLFAAALGISTSWLIQRGMNSSSLIEGRMAFILLLLLLLINLGRGIANFLKQFMMVRLNINLNSSLMDIVLGKIFAAETGRGKNFNIKQIIGDVQKVQAAVSGFIAVICSDGLLILVMLCSSFYYSFFSGLNNLIFLLIAAIFLLRSNLRSSFSSARLSHLSRRAESSLVQDNAIRNAINDCNMNEHVKGVHQGNYEQVMAYSELVALRTGRINMLLELIGTINVCLNFVIGLHGLTANSISYTEFMLVVILSYLIFSLVPKFVPALSALAEGGDAAIQLNNSLDLRM